MFLRSIFLFITLSIPLFAISQKKNQTITFESLPLKTFGNANFDLTAKASSELPVSYLSSNSQVATVSGATVTIIGAGETTITAMQSGNEEFNAAPNVAQTLTISKADQTITFSGINEDHTYGDQSFSLGASLSSGLQLTYTVSNPQVGFVSSNGFFHITGAGESKVTAFHPGSVNYNATASVSKVIFVRKATQTINFPSQPIRTFGNVAFDPAATSSSGLAIVYNTSDPSVAIIQNNKVQIIGAGSVDITANQLGDDNFFAAATVTKTITIQKAPQALTFTSASAAVYGASPIAVTATSNVGLPVTSFHSQYDSIATIENAQLIIQGAGTTTITAYQSGNHNYLPAQKTQTFTVNKASQLISFSAPTLTFGGPPSVLNAASSSGLPVTYVSLRKAVALTSGNTLVAQGLGTTTIVASQSGNSNYLPAPNVSHTVTVSGSTSAFQMRGSTQTGGSGSGTLFRINSDGTNMATSFNFQAASLGLPNGGLMKASDNKLYGVIALSGSPGNGVVFSISADGTDYSVIHNFSNTDGSMPSGNVIEASNGYLYGATLYGGLNAGVIYRLKKDGSDFSVLHQFNSGYYGGAGLVQAADGKLYGATLQGGSGAYGTLYSINLDGTGYAEFLSFDGASKGSTPRGSLIQGPDLFLYGITAGGGSLGNGVLYKVKPDGTSFTKLVEFDGTAKGANGAASPIFGSDGKLYAMTQRGGTYGYGIIFSVSNDGTGFQKIFDFNETNGNHPMSSLIEGSDGYLYGMTNEGGTNNLGTTFKVMKNGSGFVKLIDFNITNGASPQLGPLLEVQNGIFLGITYRGGASDTGIIFSVTSDGTFNLIKDFPQPPSRPQSLIYRSDYTRMFGITGRGGTYGGGSVFSVMNDGSAYQDLIHLQGDAPYYTGLTHSRDNSLWGIGREGVFTFAYFLFRINDDGSDFQRIEMNDPAIAVDARSLVDFSTDYMYGASVGGGSANSGTIFKIKKDGTGLAKVVDIPGGVSGSRPYVQVIKHSNGDLYGVTHEGGANNDGVVFKVTADGTYTKLTDLKQSIAGAYPKYIIELNGGSLCVATGNGGATNRGCLFIVDEDGQGLEKIFDFTAQTGSAVNSLVQSADGYIFVTLESEGLQNRGSIIRILPDGSGYLKVIDFNQTNGSSPNNIIFEKLSQTITSFEDIPQKQFLDPPFVLKAASSSGAPIHFTSSDPAIASVNGYVVTVHKIGTVKISAQLPGSGNYTASPTVEKTFTIVKRDQQLTFEDFAQRKFGAPDFKLVASSTSKMPVSFSSSNPAVATVNRGRVTIVGVGTTTITASVAPNPNLNPVIPQQKLLTVTKGDQAIQFDPIAIHYVDAAPFNLSATNASGFPINFTSSDQTVATVTDSQVALHKAGQSLITASSAELDNYNGASLGQVLTAVKHEQTIIFDALQDRSVEDISFKIHGAVSTSGLPVTLLNASSNVSITDNIVSIIGAGRVTFNATQDGNFAFNAAVPISHSFCILPKKPEIAVDSIDATTFVLTSSVADGNQWFRNGVLIVGETSQTLHVMESGIYTVRVSIGDCIGDISYPQGFIITGLESREPNKVFIYPNPAEKNLFVSTPSLGTTSISVMSLTGGELFRTQATGSLNELNVESLQSGVYLIQIQLGSKIIVNRFVKK